MKSNKKVFIIGAVVILVIGLIAWYLGRDKSTTGTTISQPSAADTETARHIREAIEYIKGNQEWYNQIVAGQPTSGLTINQAVAYHAIWSVKTSGKIPMTFGGSGEWGHKDYVKANY